MGSSVSFLYRVIATVEIVSSGVITIFGVNTFLLFNQMNKEFQRDKEMIYYSSIVSVVQSILTIIASIILIGCYINASQPSKSDAQHGSSDQKQRQRQSQIGQQNSLQRKAIAPTWIAWTMISVASLLFVFIAPIHYCLQSAEDLQKLETLPMKNGYHETLDNKRLGLCYSEAPELMPIRNSLGDLYSFALISIMFKALFALLVYKNWRRELRRGKKVMIYVQGCESSTNDQDFESPSTPTDHKLTSSGATTSGIDKNGGGGDATAAGVEIVIHKPK